MKNMSKKLRSLMMMKWPTMRKNLMMTLTAMEKKSLKRKMRIMKLVSQMMNRAPKAPETSRVRSMVALAACFALLLALVYLFSNLYLPVPWKDDSSAVTEEKRILPVVPTRRVPPRPARNKKKLLTGRGAAPGQ